MTNFRSLSDLFKPAMKLAAACAFAATVTAVAVGQTNTFPTNGNAGVNTTSPPNPLTITRSGSTPYTNRPAFELLQLVDKTDNTPQMLFGSAYNGMILRYTGTDGTALNQRLGVFTGAGGESFVINNDGLVGIGTISPSRTLSISRSVNPSIAIDGPAIDFSTNQQNAFGAYADDAAELSLSNNSTGGVWLKSFNKAAPNGIGAYLTSYSESDLSTFSSFEFVAKKHNGAGGLTSHGGSARIFSILNNSTNLLNVLGNGKVGIGTTNPEEKLHVAGSIKVDGNINAKYQDLAEWVPSAEQLAPSTVVVLDTTKSNQVISSSRSYDTRVAGVISAQPGITLGESGEGKVLVASNGRVRVKVDASRGPIQIGDLLVTSDVLGVAMKSEPVEFAGRKMHMPGTIIGKALEPLAKGQGEILVLLSLQ